MTSGNRTGRTASRGMPPKTVRRQSSQHDGSQRATSTMKYSMRVQTKTRITTEYQERFLHPCSYKTVITTSKLKNPYHPLKGTSYDIATPKLRYVKRIKNPPKAQEPCALPKYHPASTNAPHNPVENQMATQVEDKSVFQYDFQPFESITSYRSAYVSHPMQPRTPIKKPVAQLNKSLLHEPAVSATPKGIWDRNRKLFDEAGEFCQQFQALTLETKLHEQGRAKESNPPADHNQLFSTKHADYRAQNCKSPKLVLPPIQTSGKEQGHEEGLQSLGNFPEAPPCSYQTSMSC